MAVFDYLVRLLAGISVLVAFFGISIFGSAAGDEITKRGGNGVPLKYGSVLLAIYLTWALAHWMMKAQ